MLKRIYNNIYMNNIECVDPSIGDNRKENDFEHINYYTANAKTVRLSINLKIELFTLNI